MGGVVRPETDGKDYQRAKRQTNGTQPPAPADVWKTGQDVDEVDVAEATDEEGDAEENAEELQADWQQDLELVLFEIPVAGGVAAVAPLGVLNDVDDAEVQRGHHPEHDAGKHGVARSATHRIPEGEGHPQVALHTHSCEEQGAVVDGDEEHKTSEGTQGVGHHPHLVVEGLLHLKRQDSQEDEVGDGEVEEEDVYRDCLATHLAAQGAECQDVGGDPRHEGEDVDGKHQPTVHHGDCSHQGFSDSLRHSVKLEKPGSPSL